jgi:hypothetical protein
MGDRSRSQESRFFDMYLYAPVETKQYCTSSKANVDEPTPASELSNKVSNSIPSSGRLT